MAEIYTVDQPARKFLFEGVQGENEARSIQFDITPWTTELGDGAVTATAKRPTDAAPYPVAVTRDGNTVTWKPTSTDTAIDGAGMFQLEYTVDDVLAKTCIWSTMVAPSLDPAGDPPDPYDNWLAEMREIAADAIQAAQDADDSADDAQAEVYEAEAWAKGTKNGTPVSSSDAQYQNNSKYFSEESYKNAEAWAVGQRGGVDVPSTDPTYENNSKYWAEQSLANQYGAYIVKSASGDIASFNDGADNVPMKSLNVTITPKQSGSGDPSPSNVRPITGWTDADVRVTNNNTMPMLKDGTYGTSGVQAVVKDGVATFSGVATATGNLIIIPLDEVFTVPDRTCYLHQMNNVVNTAIQPSFELASDISGTQYATSFAITDRISELPEAKHGKKWDRVRFYVNNGSDLNGAKFSPMVCFTDASIAFEPYTGHTTPVPLGQTVYGGTVNPISGELVIDKAGVDLGTLAWTLDASYSRFYTTSIASLIKAPANNWTPITGAICSNYSVTDNNSTAQHAHNNQFGVAANGRLDIRDEAYTTAAAFKTAMNGVMFVYPLKTPTTVQLTPTQVATLLGTNNVWADCGSVEVEYRADPTLAYNELANVIVSLGGNL